MKSSGALKHPTSELTLVKPKTGNTSKLISAHYLEIGYLLDRIDTATTHYQVLGIERSVGEDVIVKAYHDAIAVLHPAYYKVRASVPDELLAKVDDAFKKLSQAFLILTSPRKRAEYDISMTRSKAVPLPLEIAKPKKRTSGNLKRAKARAEQDQAARPRSGPIAINMPVQRVAYTKLTAESVVPVSRRRCERYNFIVPVFVKGYDRYGNRWQEVTKTINVSRMGVAIRLQARLRHGSVVHVTLPLPTKLRSQGFSDPGYNMYAIVRHIEPSVGDVRIIGLEFIGSQPPGGYLHKPWSVFRTPPWNGPNRRREPRIEHAENVLIEYLDEAQEMLTREVTRTENVSLGGARILVKHAPEDFEMVRITSASRDFNSLALVRNRFNGGDGHERLCLQFTEATWPVE